MEAALLYSNDRRYKWTRRLLLWTGYALYFTLQGYYPTGPVAGISWQFLRVALVSTAAYFPFCFGSAYALLYYLYPHFLQRGRFMSFFAGLLLVAAFGIVLNDVTGLFFYRYSGRGPAPASACLALGFHNVTIAIITSFFFLGLRLGRDAWVQHTANVRLAAEKARAEVQLLKTRIDPRFLFSALDELRIQVAARSPEAPAAILRLSEALSNILYEEGSSELAFTPEELPAATAVPLFQKPTSGTNRKIYNLLFSPKLSLRLTRHGLFWLTRLINLTFALHAMVFRPPTTTGLNWITAWRGALSELVGEMALSYGIAYGLFPLFFERRKYGLFAGTTLVLLTTVFILTYYNQEGLRFLHYYRGGVTALWVSVMNFVRIGFATWLFFIALRLFKQLFQRFTERDELAKEKADVEFQLLKAQVHPHFLFNTLNNIYSFSLDGSPRAGELLDRLSAMMSYMIYDCEAESIPLDRELHLLEDYIGLEKARYGDRLDIDVSIQGPTHDRLIAPLLMIPFVENCFKHGASQVLDHPWIRLQISAGGETLDFKLSNNKPPAATTGNGRNGIGLRNIRQRLELLYPNHYRLDIESTGELFSVHLLVPLKGESQP
jgi:sensor histidine kinase YesM